MEKKCLIVNVEAFSTKNEYLENRISEKLKTGSIVILDESTKIKSPKAGRTKRIIKMFESAKYKLILTGTEITNSLFDIYSQFQFLKKNFWESKRREWKNYYLFSHYFGEFQKVKMGAHIEFDKLISYRRINELLETIKPHCYRIRKNECLDLPDKIYQDIEIEMNSEQRRIYTELRNDMTTQYQGQELSIETKISLFTRCRQITGGFMPESGQSIGKSNPKLDFILAECENKSKAIIWCSFRPEIEFITKRLNEELGDGSAVPFYGGMKKQEEIEAQEKFRDDPNCYYFVASCAKGAFGLNLQFSSLSYFFTKSLSIEHVEQCEGRQHRAGQVNKVTYKNLICKNSIDEHIKKLLERGMSLVNAVKDMTIDDIFKIV
jgi:SNF2 family DNA or RNA helicase